MGDGIGVAVKVDDDVMLDRQPGQFKLHRGRRAHCVAAVQQAAKETLPLGTREARCIVFAQTLCDGSPECREVPVEVLTVLEIEAPDDRAKEPLRQTDRIGKRDDRDATVDAPVPVQRVQCLEHVLQDKQAGMLVRMQAGMEIDAAAVIDIAEPVRRQAERNPWRRRRQGNLDASIGHAWFPLVWFGAVGGRAPTGCSFVDPRLDPRSMIEKWIFQSTMDI